MFFVGVVPAVLLMIIRGRVLESGRFSAVVQRRQAVSAGRSVAHDDKEFMRFVPIQLFDRQNRYNTFVGLLFRARLADGDLDDGELAADDPSTTGGKRPGCPIPAT